MAKTAQEQLQEAYLSMKGILSEEDNKIVTEILALDELSKATLGSYLGKSVKEFGFNKYYAGHEQGRGGRKRGEGSEELSTAAKRLKGITNATKRLTKEQKETIESILEELEDDQIVEGILALDELSKTTLASYIGHAAGGSNSVASNAYAMGQNSIKHSRDVNDKQANKVISKTFSRIKGIKRAAKRLAKEQAEPILAILDSLTEEDFKD